MALAHGAFLQTSSLLQVAIQAGLAPNYVEETLHSQISTCPPKRHNDVILGKNSLETPQRREDMTSRRSDNSDALITFQGQESRMQVTRMALWTKSRWALNVFY